MQAAMVEQTNAATHLPINNNPLSPPSDPVQRRLQSPPAKSNFLAVRVGRPQKPALFINKALAPFRGATSNHSAHGGQSPWAVYEPEITLKTAA